jgi:hypothetical protein
MNGELRLYFIVPDRYIHAHTLRELVCKLGGGSIQKIWAAVGCLDLDHIGYRIGGRVCLMVKAPTPLELANAEPVLAGNSRHA